MKRWLFGRYSPSSDAQTHHSIPFSIHPESIDGIFVSTVSVDGTRKSSRCVFRRLEKGLKRWLFGAELAQSLLLKSSIATGEKF
ncbi:MAG: hypothetical protein PHS41_00240 [Victivallaceae bacterium]|nr:hypothetical protein [Victivallaceae bacterium]